MLTIGSLNLKTPLLLAPMAGITDHPFRVICKNFGASLVYTEFVSSNGIIRENNKTLQLIRFTDEERPIGVQIFGEDPEIVSKSAMIDTKQAAVLSALKMAVKVRNLELILEEERNRSSRIMNVLDREEYRI